MQFFLSHKKPNKKLQIIYILFIMNDIRQDEKVEPGPWEILDNAKHLQDIEIFDVPPAPELNNIKNKQKKNSKKTITSSLYKIFNHKSISIKDKEASQWKHKTQTNERNQCKNVNNNSIRKLFQVKNTKINKNNTEGYAYSSSKAIGAERTWNEGLEINNKKDKGDQVKTQKSDKNHLLSYSPSIKVSPNKKQGLSRMRMNSEKSYSLNTYLLNSRVEFQEYLAKKQSQTKSFRMTEMLKSIDKKDSNNFFTDSNIYRRKEKEEMKRKVVELRNPKKQKQNQRIFSMEDKWELNKKHNNFKKFQKGCFDFFPGV